jgi:NADH-quinone oxidoreductase subunit N
MNLMAESRHLLMIYLSLEMVSVISFVMAGFKINDGKSSEAALKYVIFGGVASGIMLYGMSWIFGITQSLYLASAPRGSPPSRPRRARCPRSCSSAPSA